MAVTIPVMIKINSRPLFFNGIVTPSGGRSSRNSLAVRLNPDYREATVSAAETTGGSAAASALAGMEDRIAMANAALAANGEINDRITVLRNDGVLRPQMPR